MSYLNQINGGLIGMAGCAEKALDYPSTRRQSVTEELGYRIAKAEEELTRLKEAKAALDSNPEIERVLTLLGRI